MNKDNATYLGDGIYASFNGWQIELSIPGASIYLEDWTLEALINYAERVGLLHQEGEKKDE